MFITCDSKLHVFCRAEGRGMRAGNNSQVHCLLADRLPIQSDYVLHCCRDALLAVEPFLPFLSVIRVPAGLAPTC